MLHFEEANPDTMKNEAIIWERIKNDSSSIHVDHYMEAEVELLKDQEKVFFGTELTVQLQFQNYPCYIQSTSKALLKVIIWYSFYWNLVSYKTIHSLT